MIIVKNGKIPNRIICFECDYCGCLFEAEKGEYLCSSQMEVLHNGLGQYKCKCPCCNNMVFTKDN